MFLKKQKANTAVPHLMNPKTNQKFLFCITALLMFALGAFQASAQITLGALTNYTQNFDGMGTAGTAAPAGWFTGTNNAGGYFVGATLPASTSTVIAGTGTGTGGGAYNLGVAGVGVVGDRALGTLAASSAQRNIEVRFVNGSGSSIGSFTVSYNGEQWRNGATSVTNTLIMLYSTDGTQWTPMGNSFNFISPINGLVTAAALDGNASANRVTGIGGTYTPAAPVPNGGTYYFRWSDQDDVSNDNMMAIDDLTITPNAGPTQQFWDVNGSTAGIGGAGTWDTTTANFNPSVAGTGTAAVFSSAGYTVFGGTAGTVTLASGGVTANGGLRFDTTGYTIQSDTLTLGSRGISVSNGLSATVSSAIAGSSGLRKEGTGSLTLSGNLNYTGDTALTAGGTVISGSAQFPSTSLSLGGGATLNLGTTTLTNDVPAGTTNFLSGVISGTAATAIVKNGSGALVMDSSSSYTGSNIINAGIIGWGTASSVNWGANVPTTHIVVNGSGVKFANATTTARTPQYAVDQNFDLTVDGSLVTGDVTPGSLTFSCAQGAWTLGNGNRTITVGGSGTQLLIGGTNNTVNGNHSIGESTAGTTLTKAGPGNLTLVGTNTYTGDTIVSAGTLQLNDPGAASGIWATMGTETGTLELGSGTTLVKGAQNFTTLEIHNNPLRFAGACTILGAPTTGNTRNIAFTTGTISFPNPGSAPVTLRNNAASAGVMEVRFVGGGFNFSENLAIGVGGDLGVVNLGLRSPSTLGAQTFSGVISGPGQVVRNIVNTYPAPYNGPFGGDSIFSNGNNTYTNGTSIGAGYIGLGADNCLGYGNVFFRGDNVASMGLFASGGARTLTNAIVADQSTQQSTNLYIKGSADLTLSGTISLNTNAANRTFFTI
ncbi:MAG: outer rane autotransporter barrel, partial [Verrucomicrobiales bacterium]|nr:outer rane autotransporter barrel [Verrucomicrobiales bacterium]